MGRQGLLVFISGAVAACTFPFVASAQVIINEAMYDPPGTDSGQEWIELYNTGTTDIDLTKYKFVDGGSTTKHGFNIPPKNGGTGSIVISPGGYVIVADDAAAFAAAHPSVVNVIDSTMNMPDPNAGVSATLTLIDDTGAITDTFTYTGGTNADNKGDSVQRAGGSIIPAVPTPGGANASVADTQIASGASTSTSASQSSQSQASSAPTSSYVPPPAPTLFANAGNDRTVIVGADSEFNASAYDRGQNILDDSKVRFSWNFGDGETGEGEVVEHHFTYPGRYAVVLTIAQDKTSASDEIIVTAEPAKLTFQALPDGGIRIDNLAGRDLDLSGWIVRADGTLFAAKFVLPVHSIILSGSSMYVNKTVLGFAASAQVLLQYPNGVVALNAGETSLSSATPAPIAAAQPPTPISASPPRAPALPAKDFAQPVSQDDPTPATESAATSSQAAAAASTTSSGIWWIVAIVLAVLSAGAIAVARRFGKDEWQIVE